MNGNDFMMSLMGAMENMNEMDEGGHDATPEEIKALGASYLEKHNFELWQLVTWKDGMDNCKYPKPGEPAVIIEKGEFRSDKGDDGTMGGNHDCEPHSIRIGIVQSRTGSFEAYWVDGNRFQPYE